MSDGDGFAKLDPAEWHRVRVHWADGEAYEDEIEGRDRADALANAETNWITENPHESATRVEYLGAGPTGGPVPLRDPAVDETMRHGGISHEVHESAKAERQADQRPHTHRAVDNRPAGQGVIVVEGDAHQLPAIPNREGVTLTEALDRYGETWVCGTTPNTAVAVVAARESLARLSADPGVISSDGKLGHYGETHPRSTGDTHC